MAAQVQLIQAHPDLGAKAKMTDASVQEQAGAGLDQLSPEEFATFSELNQAYRDRFQFPFIVAVKEHTKTSILAAFRQRLTHDAATERETALTEIAKIAGYRLNALVQE
jgi:2-oxo-4-hydroxy-4-carboxy-5-ureidoimidazoline decarboxylase